MLCCALILALLALPAMIVRRYLMPKRANPLAWRPGANSSGSGQPGGLPRQPQAFLRNRARSFIFAGAGIRHVIRHEPAAVIHTAATVIALSAAFVLDVTAADWRWIAFAVLAVWSAEAFNTAIESTCDLLSPQFSLNARIAKDAAAGAVLLICLGALVIGLITFWPYLVTAPPQAPGLPHLLAAFCQAPT